MQTFSRRKSKSENDIFRTTIPLISQAGEQGLIDIEKVLEFCAIAKTRVEIQRFSGIKSRRYFIEKAFNNLKNELDFHRLRTQLNKTMDGRLFVAFIALIKRTALFGKIKLTTLFHDRRLFMPLTKLQKKILKITLNNEEAIFDDLISSKDQ